MSKITISVERCKGCCLCVSECPRGNIRMSTILNSGGHSYAEIIDQENCTGCALCCQMCAEVAIEIKEKQKTGDVGE